MISSSLVQENGRCMTLWSLSGSLLSLSDLKRALCLSPASLACRSGIDLGWYLQSSSRLERYVRVDFPEVAFCLTSLA